MNCNNYNLSLQIQFSWLWKLANVTQNPYSYVWSNETNAPELTNGPSKKTMYVTALYFTMTCMTSVKNLSQNRLAASMKFLSDSLIFPGWLRKCGRGDGQWEGVHHLHDDNCRCCVRRSIALPSGDITLPHNLFHWYASAAIKAMTRCDCKKGFQLFLLAFTPNNASLRWMVLWIIQLCPNNIP